MLRPEEKDLLLRGVNSTITNAITFSLMGFAALTIPFIHLYVAPLIDAMWTRLYR